MTFSPKVWLEQAPPFRRRLLAWYDLHKRDLPWRETQDPYRIWLSEIMLQQTRVAAVIGHYQRFLQRFPTVEKLASAREASVLAAWSGLGYYRRARMLHAAAKKVGKEYGGKFPRTAAGLRELPGIGRYTSAAIASIAFGEPAAVVDGNVERVVQRLSGVPMVGESVWQAAETLLDSKCPGDFNQAMMELGATICTPRQPACLMCPVADFCVTRGELPLAEKAKRQHKRVVHYLLHREDDSVLLVQRGKEESLMPGMWELPEIQNPNGVHEELFTVRHSITVTDYRVRVLRGPVPEEIGGQRVAAVRLAKLPLTGLSRKILRKAEIL
ncbi:MAG: A/G-specific adenine glycosylase [Acidobacteria bacterium]|nr:A/G-specific adenine glycosylase [Acidobacteriota bacterium]